MTTEIINEIIIGFMKLSVLGMPLLMLMTFFKRIFND